MSGDSFVLSDADIDSFIEFGYIRLQGCIPRNIADSCRNVMWEKITSQHNINKSDPSSWPVKLPIAESYGKEDGGPWKDTFTTQLMSSIDQICGVESTRAFGCGWWMITFPQPKFDTECWHIVGSWHIEGQWYPHFPYSKEVGITPVMYFSNVKTNGGGTAVAEGSHRVAARILREAGLRGMQSNDLTRAVFDSGEEFTIVELIGEPGDVILMHPLLVHARSSNLSSIDSETAGGDITEGVRFMCHPSVPLRKDMDYSKDINEFTLLEVSHICGMVNCSWQDWKDYKDHLLSRESESVPNTTDSLDTSLVALKTQDTQSKQSLFQKIDHCLRDVRSITPALAAEFAFSRKRRLEEESEDNSGPIELGTECGGESNINDSSVAEIMGFDSFKCRKY